MQEDPDRASGSKPPTESVERLYRELHDIAERLMSDQRAGHTLQATALVHELWAKIADRPDDLANHARFLRLAARAMRNLLVDHARARAADKRGRRTEVSSQFLERLFAEAEGRSVDLLALDEVLERLGRRDAAAQEVVELRFFAGLTVPETARALGVSETTVERKWRTARAWVRAELSETRS